jgi:fused signal recognition particle receptor
VAFFDKITQGLKKTRDTLFGQVASVFQHGRELDEEDYEALEAALLRADVGPSTTEKILMGVRHRLMDGSFQGDSQEALRAEIENILSAGGKTSLPPTGEPSRPASDTPYVILVVGVNGSGKTTTIAKLADRYKRAGDSVLLVAFDGMARAKSRGVKRVLVDTAGRLHVQVNLMEEVKKIRRVIEQQIPGAPHEVLLILDATTGQNGLSQAREFGQALGVTGLALTKLDGSAKGGVALAIADTLRLPIRWVGVGEGMEDLIPFEASGFAKALVLS